MDEPDFEKEAAEADRLAELVKSADSLDPVYASLDDSIAALTAEGYQPSDLLPAEAEPGIGFSLNQKRDGKTLWQAIAVAGRQSICDPQGEVRKKLSGSNRASTGALVTTVMFTLGLPLIAVSIAVAIVGVILAIGLNGFCSWASAPADESSTP